MRQLDVNATKIYRWLHTHVSIKGNEYHSAYGPWARKQAVNHPGGAIRAELQQLSVNLNNPSGSILEWVTIKTVELKNP